MLHVKENLGSKEAAINFNNKISSSRSGSQIHFCLKEVACEDCFHVISDSVCMCLGGLVKCPNCGNEKQKNEFPNVSKDKLVTFLPLVDILKGSRANNLIINDYSI